MQKHFLYRKYISLEIGVWVTAIRQTPIAPYHATTIQCEGSRKKRRVNRAGDGFIVGKKAVYFVQVFVKVCTVGTLCCNEAN